MMATDTPLQARPVAAVLGSSHFKATLLRMAQTYGDGIPHIAIERLLAE